jgi:integrase/recombinase XerC
MGSHVNIADSAITEFLKHLRDERGLSPHTLAAYGRDLSRLRAAFAGAWPELEPATLRGIAAGMARQGSNPRTILRFLSAVRGLR